MEVRQRFNQKYSLDVGDRVEIALSDGTVTEYTFVDLPTDGPLFEADDNTQLQMEYDVVKRLTDEGRMLKITKDGRELMTQDIFALEDIVHDKYHENRDLTFETPWVEPMDVFDLLYAVGDYNEFRAHAVSDKLEALMEAGAIEAVKVGRSNSPLIKVAPRDGCEDLVIQMFTKYANDISENNGHIRIWWD